MNRSTTKERKNSRSHRRTSQTVQLRAWSRTVSAAPTATLSCCHRKAVAVTLVGTSGWQLYRPVVNFEESTTQVPDGKHPNELGAENFFWSSGPESLLSKADNHYDTSLHGLPIQMIFALARHLRARRRF